MIKLKPILKEEKEIFFNINQKYLYEMTNYYPDNMDKNGNYHYGYFDEYFIDPKRKAYFIYNDETMIGFIMINPYSLINHNPDYVISEFTIFPSFRKKGYAFEVAKLIFSTFLGKWEIKFNNNNLGAKALWIKATKPYNPTFLHLNENETILEFDNL